MRLVMLGPPGAGKGTQAVRLAAVYGVPHIATGDIFRSNVAEQTPLGRKAEEYMGRGDLVPDDVVIDMVTDRLEAPDTAPGFLLDGFPRTVPQALALEEVLEERACPLDAVVRLVVTDEEVITRLDERSRTEDRSDDAAETVRNRLSQYRAKTEPLEAFYAERSLLCDVDGIGVIDEVTRRTRAALDETRDDAPDA